MTIRYASNKSIHRIVADLVREGWEWRPSHKHPRVVSPDGRAVSYSCSPSGGNAHKAFARDVQRIKASA